MSYTLFKKAIDCLHSVVATIEIELATIKAQIERLENVARRNEAEESVREINERIRLTVDSDKTFEEAHQEAVDKAVKRRTEEP